MSENQAQAVARLADADARESLLCARNAQGFTLYARHRVPWLQRSFGWMVGLLLLLVPASVHGPALAQSGTILESRAKAICLINFFKFTDWPREAFASDSSPFVLGILGNDPLGEVANLMTQKPVKNRSIVIKPCKSVAEARSCHILYISDSEKGRFSEIFEQLKGSSVLTVGETETFTKKGGIITLTVRKKPQFEISMSAVARSQLKIHSQIRENGLPVN